MILRPYQQAALAEVKSNLRAGVHRQLVKMATGLGKTPFLASLPDALGFAGRMLVVVHREELARQAAEKLQQWNPKRTVGIEMASRHARATDQLVVASVQTLGRRNSPRLAKFRADDFDAVVVDECHHATADSYRTILDHFRVFADKHRLCLGVTATPNRADGQGLGSVFSDVVFEMGILEGIREGWLADLKGYRLKTQTALDSVRTRAGDFAIDQLEEVVNTLPRNHLIARAWGEYGEGRQTIAFAVDVQHAKDLAAAFRQYGIGAEAIWGDDPTRREKLERHRRGDLKVLVNCQVLTEGYDDWRVGCIMLARPTQSELLYTQIIGRGTRIPSDVSNLVEARQRGAAIAKEDCLLIDVVDITKRHSLVTLPALFGLHPELDLRGESLQKTLEEVETLQAARPQTDLRKFADLVDLHRYMERLDLFRSSKPPEILPLSPNNWRREGKSTYRLPILPGESVVIVGDALQSWQIVGQVNGQRIREMRPGLSEAIREADAIVQRFGGPRYAAMVHRTARWRNDPPTPAQIKACQNWRIPVPAGATKGELHDRLDEAMRQKAMRG